MCDMQVSGQISRACHSQVTCEQIIKIYINLHVCHSRVAEQIYQVTRELRTRSEQIC